MVISSIKCPECGGDKAYQTGPNQYDCQYCGATFVSSNGARQTPPPAYNAGPAAAAMATCPICGGQVPFGARKCQHCGEWFGGGNNAVPVSTKNKTTAGLLALFLGGLGIHEFYLGKNGAGVAFLIISMLGWLLFFVPNIIIGIITLIQAIQFFTMSDQEFAAKYH